MFKKKEAVELENQETVGENIVTVSNTDENLSDSEEETTSSENIVENDTVINDETSDSQISENNGIEEAALGGEKKSFFKMIFNKKVLFIVFACALIGALVGGGVYVYRKALQKQEKEPSTPVAQSTPTPLPTPTPEASTSAELKRGDLKIKVLNGSGEAGAASTAKKLLEGKGYQDVATGNAVNYDFKKTEVAIKNDKKNYLDLLTKDLSEKYQVASESSKLDAKSEFDAIITVGPVKS